MPDRITMLNIEFNSSCNLRCRWCALDHTRPRAVMATQTLETLCAQLAGGSLPNLARLDLHNGGETLLHPDLQGMLAVLRAWRPSLDARISVNLLTNAMLLTERKSRQILDSGVVDTLRFSIDGGSPEGYESIRQGARWQTLQRNILRFMRLNRASARPLATEAICMVPEGHTAPMHPAFAELLGLMDRTTLRHPHNWDGSVELGVDDASYRRIAESRPGECCFLLERNLVVLPDGTVTVCCNDLNARGVIGTIHEQDIRTIAASPQRLGMQAAMRAGRRAAIPLCHSCTGFFRP